MWFWAVNIRYKAKYSLPQEKTSFLSISGTIRTKNQFILIFIILYYIQLYLDLIFEPKPLFHVECALDIFYHTEFVNYKGIS